MPIISAVNSQRIPQIHSVYLQLYALKLNIASVIALIVINRSLLLITFNSFCYKQMLGMEGIKKY